MQIHRGYNKLMLKDPVVTMGIFDGVHRGHRALIDTVVRRASSSGGESAAITFDPHPRLVLDSRNTNLAFLNSMDEKIQLLEKAGIDNLIIIEFTPAFSKMRACYFVSEVLGRKIGTRRLVLGHDHHFGYKAEGNAATISDCAAKMGFSVEQIPGLRSKEGPVSSSLIREALLAGNLDNANKWLGYCYSMKGEVVRGKKIGRKLGFPTANINPGYRYKLIPANGVYAVEVFVTGERHTGMLSIGTNPTVNTDLSERSVEVHIFDYEQDIYGQEIAVTFRYRLRDEVRFDSATDLAVQMRNDREVALRLLR